MPPQQVFFRRIFVLVLNSLLVDNLTVL